MKSLCFGLILSLFVHLFRVSISFGTYLDYFFRFFLERLIRAFGVVEFVFKLFRVLDEEIFL